MGRAQMVSMLAPVIATLTGLLAALAGARLVVGSIGIMTTLLVRESERSCESA